MTRPHLDTSGLRQLVDELRAEADEAHRKLDQAQHALALMEGMYHRVAREHLATAIHLHKARAKLRDYAGAPITSGTGVNSPGITITYFPPSGPEVPPGFHALLRRGLDAMGRRGIR